MGVITISREMGSEGSYIGKKVAEQLGLNYVDKQDLAKVMREYGFSFFDEVYDSKPNFWERFDFQRSATIDFLMQTMTALAKVGDVVMVGRGGFGLFRDYVDVLHVRIKAPFDLRVQRQMMEHGMERNEARVHLEKYDQVRKSFVESDLHLNSNDASMFDVVLDTGIVSPDTAVLWITEAYRQMMTHGRFGFETGTSTLEVDPVLFKHVQGMFKTN